MIVYKCDYCGRECKANIMGEMYTVKESADMYIPSDEYNNTLLCRKCLNKLKERVSNADYVKKFDVLQSRPALLNEEIELDNYLESERARVYAKGWNNAVKEYKTNIKVLYSKEKRGVDNDTSTEKS